VSERSLIDDEFHAMRQAPIMRLPRRVNPSLAENRMSGREKLLMEARCRICHERYDLSRHHLVPHSWFLAEENESLRQVRNANANIVPLCVSCHRIVDGVNAPVSRLKKRSALRRALGSNEIAFILQVRDRDWLDEHYPKNP
jgi:hypothetical protein